MTKAALIGGAWVDGEKGHFDVLNPHSGKVLHKVGYASAADVDRAVAAARKAQPAWAALSVIERAQIMRKIHQIFLERAEPIARMITAEIGKTITDLREEVFEDPHCPGARRPRKSCGIAGSAFRPRKSAPPTSGW